MNKIISSALSCALISTLLSGCAIPGISQSTEDNSMTDSYSYTPDEDTDDSSVYSWIIQPTISADNIITFDGSQVDPDNEENSAYANYSVIYTDGKYGLIDYKGNTVISAEYEDYYTCWCGEIVLFNVIDEKNKQYEYCTIDSTKQVSSTYQSHEDKSPRYYMDAEGTVYVQHTNDDYATEYSGKKAVVVCEAEVTDEGNGNFTVTTDENPLYGLAKKGKLIASMEYTDFYAPAYKGAGATLVAFKNSSGMWGYFNSDGETVIDFKCDGDMCTYNGMIIDDDTKSHPFLFNGDYMPVSISGSYGYADKDGNLVVTPGEFEQARPVHNGRAWVRKDGLWGVIQLGDIVEEETVTETTTTTITTTTTSQRYTTTSATTSETTTTETSAVISSESLTETSPAVTSEEIYTSEVTAPAVTETEPVQTEAPATTQAQAAPTDTQSPEL